MGELINLSLIFGVFYVLYFILGFGLNFFWTLTAQRQTKRCRKVFFESIMGKDLQWVERQNFSQVVERFNHNCLAMEDGITKMGMLWLTIFGLVIRIIFIFLLGLKLSLVLVSFVPFYFLVVFLFVKILSY